MHDLKYRTLALAQLPDWGWVLNFRSDCLRPVAHAFMTNLVRTSNFCLMPAQVALMAQLDQAWTDYATIERGGSINTDPKEYRRVLSDAEVKITKPIIQKYASLLPSEVWERINNVGIEFVEQNLKHNKDIQISIHALLSTAVLESWTAFETLAADLWEVGVNTDTGEIAANLLQASKSFRSPEDNIGVEKLYEVGVNPKTHFGTFLRRTEKVTLQRLRDIQFWYGKAFGKDAWKLFDEIADGYIFALSALRNVLIHHAGKADPIFVKHAQRFPELQKYECNDEILLDGETIKKLRDAAILLGRRLIEFVDDVLTPPRQDVADTRGIT